MLLYDTDIEDVIEGEEGFVRKGGFGGEENNIEDVVVVANDLCSSIIQAILSVDFEEDINTKLHEVDRDGCVAWFLVLNGCTPESLVTMREKGQWGSSLPQCTMFMSFVRPSMACDVYSDSYEMLFDGLWEEGVTVITKSTCWIVYCLRAVRDRTYPVPPL
uniref:Uncharacterized protein n=1 Tax=Tanacetum cinerariifolium TaxID=118510 RepID=A0A6L2NNM3_TANCI|nr:hypothetical protein [Tanacetum cinerariifolium]